MRGFLFLPLLASLALQACTEIGTTVANIPAKTAGLKVEKDIIYDKADNLALDIYRPADAGAHLSPVLVFLYGGRWKNGDKDDYAFIGKTFSDLGYVTVIPDYRQYPAVTFPAFVDDAAKAVAWVEKNIAVRAGGDEGRLYLAGHSAGAHIGALLASDNRYIKKAGSNITAIRAFAGLAGPYSFTPEAADLKEIFGPPANYKNMQATSFIDGDEPPMLLLQGGRDKTVDQYNLTRLRDAITARGGDVTTKTYPDMDHVGIVAALSWLKDRDGTVAHDMDAFFRRHSP